MLVLNSYSQQYSFKNYNIYDGLAQSQVQALEQDSLGYLWIGTLGGGVNRFDGNEFITYTKSNGLSSNFILSIQAIDDNTILVGTTYGLCKITSDSIYSNFTNSPLDTLIIQDIQFPYVASSSGIYTLENGNAKKLSYQVPICGKGVYQMAFSNNTLWAATNNGVIQLSEDKQRCRTDINRVHNHHFTSIVKDQSNQIWAGSLGGGITLLTEDGDFKNLSSRDGLYTYDVSCLLVDSKNNLWIGSRGQGVSKYDGNRFIQITTKNGLANDFVNTIFEDKNGNIWFGTSNGISKYNGDKYILHEKSSFLAGGGAYNAFQTIDKNFWFTPFDGGIIQVSEDYKIKTFKSSQGFTNKRVKAIYQDKDSILWIGTDGAGLYQFKENRLQKIPIGNLWVRDIKQVDSNLFVATLGDGLVVITPDTLINFREENGLPSNRINKIQVDSVLYLATDKGIAYYLNDSIYLLNKIPKERFTSLEVDTKGNLYCGNIGRGVYIYHDKKITHLTSKNGLNSDNIYALKWEDNSLWVGTEKGLNQLYFDENMEIIKNNRHTLKEGFLGIELLRNSIYKDLNGNYWFGTVDGLVQHTPQKETKTNKPNLLLNAIELFYEPLVKSNQLGKPIKLEKTSFSHAQNHFSFRFQGVDITSATPLLYQWRLIGLDTIWSKPSTQNFATYSNLAPGNYQFEVKCINDFQESEVIKQHFTIAQPYWKSTWFIVVIILASILFLAGLVWFIIKNITKRSIEKQEKIEAQRKMIELEQQALRLQMNPHFLFNSLNAIKGAIAQQQTKEAKKSLDQFAKLMRAMLENSQDGFITLDKEINLIEQYLGLESLNHTFTYKIEKDEQIEKDLMIPAMMIQPLVENAILHGVSPLKEGGHILIKFTKNNDDMLVCEVIDNGVGLEASKKAKEASIHKQESKAITIIKSRLELIKTNPSIGLSYHDNIPNGTIVKIVLPVR